MRALAAILLLILTVMSGCAGDSSKEAPDSTSEDQTDDTAPTNGTLTDTGGITNETSSEGKQGSLTLTFTADTVNGTVGQQMFFNLSIETFFANGTAAGAPANWTVISNGTVIKSGEGTAARFNATFTEGAHTLIANATAPGFGAAETAVDVMVEEPFDPTIPPGPGEGVERDYSCTVDVGGTGFTLTGNIANYAKCVLRTEPRLSVVVSVSPASGCSINGQPEQAYNPSREFSASCGVGTVDATNAIRLRTWE